ncbi:alpha/beta fold hydrolase [Amycolatopsis magusensis]|uniref:Nucleoside-diphosphate-sugar epimerase n=1 Tax=Amycolatopsis magusensis TaxID=882444 RepID=A0ABS4Q2N0_9PSEU|nr:alpha/beta fold hydrolase [Amycolatopsis magusensis]MBP2185333.1 nucleoside-diphosphate-sugar epimerase [Amycolatopsis magusensis]
MDVVFGATGFLGRWTVLHLLGRGRRVAAVVRDPGGLSDWLVDHGADVERLLFVAGDITAGPGLGLSAEDDERLVGARDVFNVAARYRFGLSREEAQAVNVDGAVNVLRWAGTRPELHGLVHVSGYRVGLDPEPRWPLPEAELAESYRSKGAYEGSKTEADAAVRVLAAQLGIPLTVVNPSSVIGHSATGEAGQYLGLADLVRQLWTGKLPALPGTARTFVPVVTVDHFAEFLATLTEPGGRHWVLDEHTPNLPELVRLLAGHLGVPAPKLRVPVGLVRRLPTAVTGADPETLTFLTEDRYDTESAKVVGPPHPPVESALRRWADRLVADGFGAAPAPVPGGFEDVGGARTYVAGERNTPEVVLLNGLSADDRMWQDVHGQASALLADLPGLGRSGRATVEPEDWLAELLAPVRSRPVLVAHSVAAAPALRYAAAHPGGIAGVILVSPPFLEDTPLELRVGRNSRAGAARSERRWARAADDPAERRVLRALATEIGALTTPDPAQLPALVRRFADA